MQHILNFSGTLAEEGFSPEGVEIHDYSTLEGSNCFCSPESRDFLLRDLPCGGICWADTGDYHYVSLLRYLKLPSRPELLLFDQHHDNAPVEDLLSCGNWLSALPQGSIGRWYRSTEDFEANPPRSREVFLSIDLDVLCTCEFCTNWDQGTLSWPRLKAMLDTIFASHKVLGVDICGGKSRAKGANDAQLKMNLELRQELYTYLYGKEEEISAY